MPSGRIGRSELGSDILFSRACPVTDYADSIALMLIISRIRTDIDASKKAHPNADDLLVSDMRHIFLLVQNCGTKKTQKYATFSIHLQRLIALSPQPQHVESRRKPAFGLENSVELIGVRPFRPASGAISKNPAAKCELKYKAAVRGGFRPGSGRAMRSGVRSGFGCGDVLPGRGARRDARVEQSE